MESVNISKAMDSALQHYRAGRLRETEQLCRLILASEPKHAGALHVLGMLAYRAHRCDTAIELIRQSITLDPQCSEAFNNLGQALLEIGRLDESVSAHRQAIDLKPNVPALHNHLAIALRANGRLDESMAAARRAIALDPGYAQAYRTLANGLRDSGRLDLAIATYREALALKPDYAEAHGNLGIALSLRGQMDAAIAAFEKAIALKPNAAAGYSNLAEALTSAGRAGEAVAACRQAIALNPRLSEARNSLGNALKEQGQLNEALAAYREALALQPGNVRAHSNLVYLMLFHPDCSARAIAEELCRWNEQHALPLLKLIRPHSNDRSPDRRLRVGYVSPDFKDHVVGINLLPLFREHDHDRFDITCYAHVPHADAFTAEFEIHADRWRSSTGLTDDQLAQQIRDDQIDILVDLTLHMSDNRLLAFARKPAPVQVTFAGYPGSTGLAAMDYRLSDAYLDPVGMDETIYSERTIRLPGSFWCYQTLGETEIVPSGLPALKTGFVTFGCLNNPCKINNRVLALWAKVLLQIEGARLLLLAEEGSYRERIANQLSLEGVHPARVQFSPRLPRRQYFELYHRIDVGLDSFPYNGHSTSLDSLWMGVPVVTLKGETAVCRAGFCHSSNLGLPELTAESDEEFVRIASNLAGDIPKLESLRLNLRRRMQQSVLMDAPRFARGIEEAYRLMWQRWCETV